MGSAPFPLRPDFGSAPGDTVPTVPDIGDYEVQQDDVIFDNGFDGCP